MAPTVTLTEDVLITQGPSREELFDALRLFAEGRRVDFRLRNQVDTLLTLKAGFWLRAQIKAIEVENRSGHSWKLRVHFSVPDEIDVQLTNTDDILLYYNGNTRTGKVVDATPADRRVSLNRDGGIFIGHERVGSLQDLSPMG